MSRKIRRRSFRSAVSGGGAIGLSAMQYSRVYGANRRMGIASVGVGGKGWSDLTGVAASPEVEVVALCDIDSSEQHLGRAAKQYPAARQHADWRRLLDDAKDIQGILVSTPDFMHAPVALAAMQDGKHVFCQKPLTHTVHEARQMRLAAEKFNAVTQMCNQIQSHSAYRTAVHMVHSGLIGKAGFTHGRVVRQDGLATFHAPRDATQSQPTSAGIFGRVLPPKDPTRSGCTIPLTGEDGKLMERGNWGTLAAISLTRFSNP